MNDAAATVDCPGRAAIGRRVQTANACLLAGICLALAPVAATATDLSVTKLEVNQQIQLGSTTMIAGRPTFVRATIGTGGEQVPGVDAALHVFVDGSESDFSPVFSMNGPITAPASPNQMTENHTVNFFVLIDESADVDFTVEVNPPGPGRLDETDFGNNTREVNDLEFECRRAPELVYVPVDYRPSGGGENPPDPDLITANVGHAFMYGIYPFPDWNYHKTPMPNLLWTTNINNSATQMLSQLSTIRRITLPGMGFPLADYIYGWLPGNPCSCNGQAIGIPGDAAFGNSQTVRHQRTYAHEVGHLFGMSHVNRTIATIGVDVEHGLVETENLPRLKASNLATIMQPGLLTNQAWIDSIDYEFTAARPQFACGNGPGGARSRRRGPAAQGPRMLNVTGIVDHLTRSVTLDPFFEVPNQEVTPNVAGANVVLEAFGSDGPAGALLHRVELNTRTAEQRCDLHGGLNDDSALSAVIPMFGGAEGSQRVDRVVVRDARTGAVLAERNRSANAPVVSIQTPGAGEVMLGQNRIAWSAGDADGDSLTYALMYSHNGGESWLPLAVYVEEEAFEFDTDSIAGSHPDQGLIRVIASDGMNVAWEDVGPLTLGDPDPPTAEIIFPNDGNTLMELGPQIFHASAWDKEDFALPEADLVWSSDVDGVFAAGSVFSYADLSVGAHVITLTATDSDGMFAEDSVSVTVMPRLTPDPPALRISLPDGTPALIAPGVETEVRVRIREGAEELDVDSPRVHHRISPDDPFAETALTPLGGEMFLATLPPAPCGVDLDFYFSARTVGGTLVTNPGNAPDAFHSAAIGVEVTPFADDFEEDLGWTVVDENIQTGTWVREVPFGDSPGAPSEDFDGSGRAYLTGNAFFEDIDGGTTRLISPTIDLSTGTFTIGYAIWFVGPSDDHLTIEISNDDGGSWTTVEIVDSIPGGWATRAIDPEDFVALTTTMRMRFSAEDDENNSLTEAAVDAFLIEGIGCPEGEAILPESFEVTRGAPVGGDLEDLFESDNQYVRVSARRPTEIAASSVEIELTATASTESPALLQFTVEAASSGMPALQRIELFDYDAGRWTLVDERAAPSSDARVTATVTDRPERFIEADTAQMKARVGFQDRGVTFPAWGGQFDQVFWTLAK
jgi:hypothetical protein